MYSLNITGNYGPNSSQFFVLSIRCTVTDKSLVASPGGEGRHSCTVDMAVHSWLLVTYTLMVVVVRC